MKIEVDLYLDLELTVDGRISAALTDANGSVMCSETTGINELIAQQIEYYRVPSGPLRDHDGSLKTTLENLDLQLRGARLLIESFQQELGEQK